MEYEGFFSSLRPSDFLLFLLFCYKQAIIDQSINNCRKKETIFDPLLISFCSSICPLMDEAGCSSVTLSESHRD
jgi:hypothetical protein